MRTDRYIVRVRYEGDTEFIPAAVFKGFVEKDVVYSCCVDCVSTHDHVEAAQVWDIITKTVIFSWGKGE